MSLARRLCCPAFGLILATASPGCDSGSSTSTSSTSTPSPSATTAPATRAAGGASGMEGLTEFEAKRHAEAGRVQALVRIPDTLAGTPAANELAMTAAPVYKKHGPEQAVTVRVIGVGLDNVRQWDKARGALSWKASVSRWVLHQPSGDATPEVYFAAAPVPDLDAFAKQAVEAKVGKDPKVDRDQRLIVLTAP
jgi:hypothetical protein